MAEHRTVVVGGGIIGVCCALELVRRGCPVTLLERGEIGGAASFGNAGSFFPGHLPINRPGVDGQALRWMLRGTSPIYFAPRVDPALWRWLWVFRRFCTEDHLQHSLRVLAPMGHRSMELARELVRDEGLRCDFREEGCFEVYVTAAGFESGRADAELLRPHGYDPKVMDGDAVREREPALSSAVLGAIHYEGATCNPHRFVTELARRAAERGATILERTEVRELLVHEGRARGVRTADGTTVEADTVLLATGVYSRALQEKLGWRLPLQPAKGYHRDSRVESGGAPALRVPCLLGESLIFCTPLGDTVRFAGTLEFSGLNHRIRAPRLEQLHAGARRYFNEVGSGGITSEWCGLRPCLPDGLPAIGWAPSPRGLFVAGGHAMMGLTLGPVTGRLAAESILDDRPSFDLRPLRVDRF